MDTASQTSVLASETLERLNVEAHSFDAFDYSMSAIAIGVSGFSNLRRRRLETTRSHISVKRGSKRR